MTNHRINDDDAAALLQGRTPEGRPELAPLAESLADLRSAAFKTVAQPSAELSARLALPRAASSTASAETSTDAVPAASPRGRVRQMVAWFTGLGIVAKILLASTVATAAVVSGGAAGVLPGGAQDTFDTVVSVVVPVQVQEQEQEQEQPTSTPTDGSTTEPTGDAEEGAHPDNFGGTVSDLAKDKEGSGYEFGKYVSNAAREKNKGDEVDDPTEDSTNVTEGSDAPEASDSDSGKPDGTGKPDTAGKPENTPGGKSK